MSFLDTLLGRDASATSNTAAANTFAQQQAAIKKLTKYGDQYAGQFRDLSTQFDPYVQSGQSALERLMAGLGLGGPGGQADFTAAYRGLPGYEAGLETGGRAVAGNANSRNMLQSGSTLKALQRFGSDYEDTRVGDYLSRLMGLGQQGMAATGQRVNTIGTGLHGQLGTRTSAFGGAMQAAPTIGQGQVAGAQAEQNALSNLMAMGAYLGGSYLGGGMRMPPAAATPPWSTRTTAYQRTPWG